MAKPKGVNEGDRVTILVGTPEGRPVKGTVRVVQDTPGKRIGIELDDYTPFAHSLDGLVDEKVQPGAAEQNLPVIGKGWWTTEDDIEVEQ